MDSFSEFLNYIARTNLFNFVIFAAIIVLICKKINVNEILQKAKTSVETDINDSSKAKEDSEQRLSSVEESMLRLETEINAIIDESEENAGIVGKKILEDAQKTVGIIGQNKEKSIENSRQVLKNELLKKASQASIEIAKARIIDELNKNQALHDKFIDESIKALTGAEL